MEAVILVGLQASGKSTFYKQNFLNSHIRISMDLMKTRNREKKFFDLCLETQAKVVIDNTNPSLVERKSYIEQLKKSGYKISGYYFWHFRI
jgi:predicted kinase